MIKILILSMDVLLQACANLGQQYEPVKQPIEESVVYFYRPSRFIGRAIPFDIKENGQSIVTMHNNGYYPHLTTAGEHTYTVESLENKDSVTIKAQKGESYYISSKIGWGVIVGRPSLEVVSNTERALSEIKDCKYILND